MKQWWQRWGIPAIGYALLVAILFGHALNPAKGMMIFGDDITHQYYFFREFFNHFLRSGIVPWWNPYIFSGQPFIADPMVNIWYPVNWLYILLPLNVAYAWHLALHIFWACLGMYVALRAMLNPKYQRFNISAWVGGVIFGLSGFFMARTWGGHVDVIAAASWMPWVVGTSITYQVSRIGERKKNLLFAACTFALQLLSGYQTMAFFTVMIVGVFSLMHAVQTKSVLPIVRAIIAGALGVGISAIQIIPEQEFFRQSIRTFALPYPWVSYGSWTASSILQFLNPFYFGNQLTYVGPAPNFIEHSAFVGIGGLVLALIGVFGLVRRKITLGISFLFLAFFGLWVSLGPNAPIDLQYILWKIIPMYRYLRIPPRHLILVIFGLAGLAGMGLNRVPGRALKALIAGVIVVEMVLFGRHFIELRPTPETYYDTALISLLRQKDTQPYRFLQDFGVWLPQREVLDFDAVMSYGIFSATGYDSSIVRRYYEYIANASGKKGSEAVLSLDVQVPYLTPASRDALDLLNIKYIMVPSLYDPFAVDSRYRLVRNDARQSYRVYENTTVKPRFYFADPCGTVTVTSYAPNRIELRVSATCTTTLMSSEVWYPGWIAKIDGKEVPIGKEKEVFRTLFVSYGNHTIIYEYRPIIFYVSAGISVLTLTTLLFIVLRTRKP